MPLDVRSKAMWIESISQHQTFCSSHFMICERHFTPDDFSVKLGKKGKKLLKKEAVPSIFDEEPVDLVQPETSYSDRTGKTALKRYCKIKYCRYENGTENKEILFFR